MPIMCVCVCYHVLIFHFFYIVFWYINSFIFSIYDKAGHLCPFDVGLIERNVMLYFSGYMKAIYEENPDPEGEDIKTKTEWN
jgi:hypothetical protein